MFKNRTSETTYKARIGLISEEEWKPYCKVILAGEVYTFQSETVCVNEYATINVVGLEDASRRSTGLDGLLWN
jgi:hypothetical protein